MAPAEPAGTRRAGARRLLPAARRRPERRATGWGDRIRSPLVVATVLLALLVVANWGSISDRLRPATPPQPSPEVAVPRIPSDEALVRAVEGTFDDPGYECTQRLATPRPALGPTDVPYVGCAVRGAYAELDGHTGSVVVAFLYPPGALTSLTQGTPSEGGPVANWVLSPGSVLGSRLVSCEEWRPLTNAVPEAAQAVGCESQTALDVFVRVALASEEVLLVVDLTAELAEPELADWFPDAGHLHELTIETARRAFAEL